MRPDAGPLAMLFRPRLDLSHRQPSRLRDAIGATFFSSISTPVLLQQSEQRRFFRQAPQPSLKGHIDVEPGFTRRTGNWPRLGPRPTAPPFMKGIGPCKNLLDRERRSPPAA